MLISTCLNYDLLSIEFLKAIRNHIVEKFYVLQVGNRTRLFKKKLGLSDSNEYLLYLGNMFDQQNEEYDRSSHAKAQTLMDKTQSIYGDSVAE